MDESILSSSDSESLDFDSKVSRLQALLEDESLTLDTECLLQTMEQCFSICSIHSLERMFEKILPKAQHLLAQVIKAIDDTITDDNARPDDLDGIKYKLQVCNGLVAFWKKCVERISMYEQIPAASTASLCDTLPETTRLIFEHCKASPKYGTLLNSVMQELKNLFANASAVLKLFFATLNDIIVFDTDVQSESELLTKVIDAYGNIASIANGLDSKTFVELFEMFAKLAIVHQNQIESYNITTHFVCITKTVSSLLIATKDENDKNAERNIMVAMRLLRILEKLTSSYSESFTREMMSDLIELLTQIYRRSCLIKSSEKILIGVTSFLNVIFSHDDFKEIYFEYGKQNVLHDQYTRRLNYHLLTIAIMKKLNGMTFEHHSKWFLDSDSILDVAFTYIEYLGEEICAGDLQLPEVHEIGVESRFVGIYEATLVSICNLVSQILPENFHALELLLLKHLLSGYFWCSLLSSDVWCFIGRLGSSQLCVDHVKHLMKISTAMVERRDSIEAIMLDNIIVRLCDLLNEDMKSTLFDNLIDLDADYYISSMHLLIKNPRCLLSERLKSKVEDLPKAFLDLQEHPSVRNWKRLMQDMFAVIVVDYNDNKDVITVLTKIWSFVADTIIECEGKQLDLLTDLVVTLLNATHVNYFHQDNFCAILISVVTSCVYLPPQGKIKICHFLRKNVKALSRYDAHNIASILTELFSCLIEDENPWVCQEALETFEHVGHVCPEQLVAKIAKSLAKKPSISSLMQAYLSSKPYYIFKGFINVQYYLKYLAQGVQNRNNEHKCHEYNESEREEKILKLEKNSCEITVPILNTLDEQAEKLYQELTMVLENQAVISETTCRRLITVLEKIVRVQENKNTLN
ncbi:hypothetical protein PUN28_000332 [Cardiocondyla obscurior]|uniref:Uncharacterized protein n=1 Tax=Cardiocondyla obscurior TaxID=286306 RepID=A0AAW2GYZ1_9HYME